MRLSLTKVLSLFITVFLSCHSSYAQQEIPSTIIIEEATEEGTGEVVEKEVIEGLEKPAKKRSLKLKNPLKLKTGDAADTDTTELDLNEKVVIDVGNPEGEGAEFGIVGENAPHFKVGYWWDEHGNSSNYYVTDFSGKMLIIFCWSDWCPACKSHGYDEMLALQDKYLDNPEVEMIAIQTVFEGKMQNNKSKVKKVREKYGFKIPMGHDEGDEDSEYRSSILKDYKTAGTPWFIVIDKDGRVIFNYHHLPLEATEEVIDSRLN